MKGTVNFLKKYFFHIIMWAALTIALCIDANELYAVSIYYFFQYVLIKTIILMILVYLNLLVLYPLFYLSRKYWLFGIAIIAIIVVAGYLNTKLEFFVRELRGFENKPPLQMFYLKQFSMAARYVLIAFLLQITVDFYEQKEKLKRIELEKTIAELNFLKAQVNPHFLFNTLNSLYALIIEKSDKSAECVLKLADILKYILAEGTHEKVALKKELLLIENYIELEKLRKPDAEVSFAADVQQNNYLITPLLLLPFVENAFKHGLNAVSKKGFIHLHVKAADNLLQFVIENNLPTQKSTLIHSHGVGVENVRKRLDLLYPNNYKLMINKKETSFVVHLQLQLK